MRPLDVLLVHDYGSPGGGAELQMLALRDGLRRRGHRVRLLSSRVPLGGQEPEADHLCFGTTSRAQVVTSAFNPSAALALRRALARARPDVVHVRMMLWQLSPAILPWLRDLPSVYHAAVYKAVCPRGTKRLPDGSPCTVQPGRACHRNGCLTWRSWPPAMAQRALWLAWKDAFDLRVTLSHAARRVLEAGGLAPVEVLHNGVPERPPRPALGTTPVVAYAGRLAPEKGVDVLLHAFARLSRRLPAARLRVYGDGPERPTLEALAEELGVAARTRFAGHLPRRRLEEVLDEAWVQAVPSLWEEPFGNVTTEALMRGTAVVASRAGAQPEILGEGSDGVGVLVPPGDVAAWAAALEPLLGDRDRAEAVGRAGRRRAEERFGEERWVDAVEGLYRRLLARRLPVRRPGDAAGRAS